MVRLGEVTPALAVGGFEIEGADIAVWPVMGNAFVSC
jgi:hypothetical protein